MFRYLLAVDDSDSSLRAAKYLANLTQLRKDLDITLIHIVNFKKEKQRISNSSTEISEIENEMIEKGWAILNKHASEFDAFGVPVKKQLLNGDPRVKITEYAKLNDYTHIVIGSRGLTDLQGLVLGSVSHQVLHHSHCPVTLVK